MLWYKRNKTLQDALLSENNTFFFMSAESPVVDCFLIRAYHIVLFLTYFHHENNYIANII